ncbi:probable WRKY transcription factor 46 [Impatiens glandulifera]|uniref:probable WRKY transcription factor 46 n=1 Tax=Impatiens glandulifera TaxID=253017 RepID=UPI001FB14BF9|nr:probable WRKY transcription factor 46 [Impatiens glandulifera]
MDCSSASRDHQEETKLLDELKQGKELAKQLLLHLNAPSTSSSHQQKGELLVQDILKTYENALSILLRWSPGPAASLESPRSEESDRDQEGSRKRKNVIRWTKKVRVGAGVEGEGEGGDLNDGYNWRKYGQKDIHKANFPRNYFRCTQRNTQGCLATKQVQISDEDPSLFNISYRGTHTCNTIQVGPSLNNNNITATLTTLSEPTLLPALEVPDSQTDQKLLSPNTLFEFQTGLENATRHEVGNSYDIVGPMLVENDHAPSTAFPETTSAGSFEFDYFASGFMDEAELSFTFDNSRFF